MTTTAAEFLKFINSSRAGDESAKSSARKERLQQQIETTPAPELVAHALFTSGDEFHREYHTFRIPALLAVPRAEQPDMVLAFAEGRMEGDADHGEVHVVLRQSEDGGLTWGALRVVADAATLGIAAGSTVGNPCPIWDEQRQRVVRRTTIQPATSPEPHGGSASMPAPTMAAAYSASTLRITL